MNGKVLLCPEDQKPCTCSGERFNDGRLKCPREGLLRARPFRSSYEVARVDPQAKVIWIVDVGGVKSVTNDAERVCEELNRLHPGHRIIYRDSMKHWDELVHLDGHFNHYAEARGMGIQV